MKKVIIIFILLCSGIIKSETSLDYKLGLNLSKFQTDNSYLKPGIILGFAKTRIKSERVTYFHEFIFTTRGGIVKDKTIKSDWGDEVTLEDINCTVDFIEYNPGLGYRLFSFSKMRLGLIGGPSIYISVFGTNRFKNQKWLNLDHFSQEEMKNYEFDYKFIDEPGSGAFLGSSGVGFHMGISMQLSNKLKFEIRYNYRFININIIDTLEYDQTYHAVDFILGIDSLM